MVLDTRVSRAFLRQSRGTRAASRRTLFLASIAASFLAACGGGSGSSGGQSGIEGEELPKPGGGTFFVDENSSGTTTRLHLAEMFWGRLVNIHDVDALGTPSQLPVFRDFVINQDIQSDGADYLLETNPITQATRLTILRTKGAAAAPGSTSFEQLLKAAASGLPVITPKDDDGSTPGPFSFVPRNGCIVMRFDDCLNDSAQAAADLNENVHILTGYPPVTPFSTRMLFDPNHGALVGSQFHSTRVLVDLTVSEAEASVAPLQVNSLGLPASVATSPNPNVSFRIPTLVDFASGQFQVLTTLSGTPVTTMANGPVDPGSPTFDVVRAMRSGNSSDQHNGFLRDEDQPEVLGSWDALFQTATNPSGNGFDFILDLQFTTVCQSALDAGDILMVGGFFLEVTLATGQPDGSGVLTGVEARVVADQPVAPSSLLGAGAVLSTYDPLLTLVPSACWIDFTPKPLQPPAAGVSTTTQVLLRFSEPMDPGEVTPFDSFVVARGVAGPPPTSLNLVVGKVLSSPDFRTFTHTPVLALEHTQGTPDPYHVLVFQPKDLAGNNLVRQLPGIDFTVDPLEQTELNGGLVLRFSATDEVDLNGLDDLRGQIFYDLFEGRILPRAAQFLSFPVDRTAPVQSIMTPFALGVKEPLSPLGCKLQMVWRHVDFGFLVLDETKHNLDVCGLNWAPLGGQVLSEFYPDFEIRLSHSARLPDEQATTLLDAMWPNSGLLGAPAFFTENILNDPLSPQKIAHSRSLGYALRPVDLFLASTDTVMLPFPLNTTAGPKALYTWRDTSVLAKAGPDGTGLPLGVEQFGGFSPPLEPTTANYADPGKVPSMGLPLLMEFRCYPTSSGVGLNSFDVSFALPQTVLGIGPPRPNFRAYSAGGVDQSGTPVIKNPDLELTPSGGFNPLSLPPGQPTMYDSDNFSYIGQLDVVIRISRAHTVWMDTGNTQPTYVDPVVEPDPGLQPAGTQVVIEYRGATGFAGPFGTMPFDGDSLNAYGDLSSASATVSFLNGISTWANDPSDVSGAQYIQARFTFLNNIDTGLSPTLSGLGLAFIEN